MQRFDQELMNLLYNPQIFNTAVYFICCDLAAASIVNGERNNNVIGSFLPFQNGTTVGSKLNITPKFQEVLQMNQSSISSITFWIEDDNGVITNNKNETTTYKILVRELT